MRLREGLADLLLVAGFGALAAGGYFQWGPPGGFLVGGAGLVALAFLIQPEAKE